MGASGLRQVDPDERPRPARHLRRGRPTASTASRWTSLSEARAAQYRNRMIGFVFQSFNLIPFKTAAENVALPLYYQGVPRKERNERAREYLAKVGLADRAEHLPRELSGGQQQRVAIARALISRPKVILADEPTGALDSQTSREVMDVLRSIQDEDGVTVLIVTHERDIAELTDRQCIWSTAGSTATPADGSFVTRPPAATRRDRPPARHGRARRAVPVGPMFMLRPRHLAGDPRHAPHEQAAHAAHRLHRRLGHPHAGRAPGLRPGPRARHRVPVPRRRGEQHLDVRRHDSASPTRACSPGGASCSSPTRTTTRSATASPASSTSPAASASAAR